MRMIYCSASVIFFIFAQLMGVIASIPVAVVEKLPTLFASCASAEMCNISADADQNLSLDFHLGHLQFICA